MAEQYFTQTPQSAHDERNVSFCFAGRTLHAKTDAGVFARGGLDMGTRVLAEALPALSGRVADYGCGWGALSLCVLAANGNITLTAIDINERAAGLCRENLAQNGLQADVRVGDAAMLEGPFDTVISNPPIRAGNAVLHALYEGAYRALQPGGSLYIVVRKQQGAPSTRDYLKRLYAAVELIARQGGYWVLKATK
nr:class I SAM-dependent methyltransferase [bacterium]